MQAAIAEPAALMRKFPQLLAQSTLITTMRLVTDHRPVRRAYPTRPPLAIVKQGLKMRDRFTLGGGRHHFLIVNPDSHCPAWRPLAAASADRSRPPAPADASRPIVRRRMMRGVMPKLRQSAILGLPVVKHRFRHAMIVGKVGRLRLPEPPAKPQ